MSESKASDELDQPKSTATASPPWELIAGLLGAVSGLSFFLSIIFDMGYLDTTGLRFADVPTTIADHVRSALLWVPQATTAALAYVLLELLHKQFSGMLVKASLSPSKRQAAVVSAIGRWAYRVLIAAAFLVVWADGLTGGQFARYAAVASTITIAYLVFAGAAHMASTNSLSPTKIVLFCVFPVLTMMVYNAGKTRAIEDRSDPRTATLTLEGQREVQVSIYRYLDRGVLGVAGEGRLVFYRWEEVKRLTSTFQAPKRVNWLCQSIGVGCVGAGGAAANAASAATQ